MQAIPSNDNVLVPQEEGFEGHNAQSGKGWPGKMLLAPDPSTLRSWEGEQKGPESLQASLPQCIWGRPVTKEVLLAGKEAEPQGQAHDTRHKIENLHEGGSPASALTASLPSASLFL